MKYVMEPKIHSRHMEIAVAKLIGWREHVIVPNVSWGLGLRHECDMLVLDRKQRLTEIEIKVSASDLRRDFEKPHGHFSHMISRLVYAVHGPVLALALEIVPKQCGLISVVWDSRYGFKAQWIRRCRHRPGVIAPENICQKLMALGCMRIWTLKQVIEKNEKKF